MSVKSIKKSFQDLLDQNGGSIDYLEAERFLTEHGVRNGYLSIPIEVDDGEDHGNDDFFVDLISSDENPKKITGIKIEQDFGDYL